MFNIVNAVTMTAMRCFSLLFPYKLGVFIANVHNKLYTYRIQTEMGQFGTHVTICPPFNLQGNKKKNISLGNYSVVGKHSIFECRSILKEDGLYTDSHIKIGDKCCIGEYCHLTACNGITIGDGLLTGRFVYIGDNSHGGFSKDEGLLPPLDRTLKSKGEIVIGNNVWIGDKATVLANVHIGDNVIIGANSVVTKNIPSNSVVVGSPAKIIKKL